jgi:hypothetical protein
VAAQPTCRNDQSPLDDQLDGRSEALARRWARTDRHR